MMSKRLYVDFHVIQTVPPSCVNRDDTGRPKTAVYGGVNRARVSSQSWKHAMRKMFTEIFKDEQLGFRTKYAVSLITEKIKEQENDINYLKNRLQNYDNTMEEMTNLNIELNRLNDIIKSKNNTIEEFREISELSRKKFEELIANKKELIQRIKILEKENEKLRNMNINKNNNLNTEQYNEMKSDLNNLIQENKELKKLLQEKDEQIHNINDIIDKSNLSSNRNINYFPNKRNYNYNFNKYRHENILRTEPNKFPEMIGSHSFYQKDEGINKYDYLKNKYRVEPLKYSNYLLDNLQNNLNNNYFYIK